MEEKYGFPVVSADNIFQVIENLGIRKWKQVGQPRDLKEYAGENLSQEEREELEYFAPKAEIVVLENPKGGIFRGYRAVMKNWTTVFALLDDNILPVTVEFKHGSNDICIVPPSGVPSRKDFGTKEDIMQVCAKREFWEETGIELEAVISLSGAGNAVTPRQSTQRFFPYLGIPKKPIVRTAQKLDRTEMLKILLIPLNEWLKLISEGKIVDECAISITLLALQKMGRIKVL